MNKSEWTHIFDRYITTLIALKKSNATVVKWCENAQDLNAALDTHPQLIEVLKNPTIDTTAKEAVIKDIGKKLGFERSFLRTIVVFFRQGRSAQIKGLTERMIIQFQQDMGIIKTHVTSVQKLTKTQEKALASRLGQNIDIETTIDPDILGGLIIQIGSWRIDDSIKGKIERLQNTLETAV